MTDQPIIVSSDPLPEQIASAARTFVLLFIAWCAGKGWLDESDVTLIGGVVGVALPIVYAQLKIRRTKRKMVALADTSPLGEVK